MLSILLVALGLAMDCFAVSICCGITLKKPKLTDSLLIATSFGGFQGGMPLLGWMLGDQIRRFVSGLDAWIAFGLLAFIGAKMLFEAAGEENEEFSAARHPLHPWTLLSLSVATSIDALAVGLSFSFLKFPIGVSAVVIGAVTFFVTVAGVYLGTSFGNRLGRRGEFLGGTVLLILAFKFLLF